MDNTLFWSDSPTVLYENPDQFYPSYDMNLVEKLNAIMRLAIYITVVLILVSRNYLYFYIPIGIGLFTYFIYKTQKETTEEFFNNYSCSDCPDGPCTLPTTDNPLMNWHPITDARDRPPACKSYNNEKVKKEIEEKFNHNLYRDVSDLYSKRNGQLIFNTTPVTTAMSDQTAFAQWLYQDKANCKTDSYRCAPEWSPISPGEVPNQIFENHVNN